MSRVYGSTADRFADALYGLVQAPRILLVQRLGLLLGKGSRFPGE